MLVEPGRRGFAFVPWLTGSQALELAGVAVAVGLVVTRPWSAQLRVALALTVGALGGAVCLGRWPPGGPRLGAWAGAALRFLARPRIASGRRAESWFPVRGPGPGEVRIGDQMVRVWRVRAPAQGLSTAMFCAPEEVSAQSWLQALGEPLQIIFRTRWASAGDIPVAWSGLDPALQAIYQAHWRQMVDNRRVLVPELALVSARGSGQPSALPALLAAIASRTGADLMQLDAGAIAAWISAELGGSGRPEPLVDALAWKVDGERD